MTKLSSGTYKLMMKATDSNVVDPRARNFLTEAEITRSHAQSAPAAIRSR
jgi:hypothetical protein